MHPITHVLCPIDFSEASRAPLRLGAAIAEHLHARLTVLTVDDPLLAQVSAHSGPSLTSESERELRRFADDTLARGNGARLALDYAVAVGKPAAEILRFARDGDAVLLDELGKVSPQQRRVVELKFSLGLTDEEAAEALNLKLRSLQREWFRARKWLFERLTAAAT
jgi:hypothetical protein